jgi:hypothetical protein
VYLSFFHLYFLIQFYISTLKSLEKEVILQALLSKINWSGKPKFWTQESYISNAILSFFFSILSNQDLSNMTLLPREKVFTLKTFVYMLFAIKCHKNQFIFKLSNMEKTSLKLYLSKGFLWNKIASRSDWLCIILMS